MDHLRDSVKLRAYGGKDPLIEYKNEGRKLFQGMLQEIDYEIAENISRASLEVHHHHQPPKIVQNLADTQNSSLRGPLSEPKQSKEIGRNELCYCSSGKKFKKCHGK